MTFQKSLEGTFVSIDEINVFLVNLEKPTICHVCFVLHASYDPRASVLFVPKRTYLMSDRDSFYHRARKSTYLQYPEKEKSLSATKYEKNAENCW